MMKDINSIDDSSPKKSNFFIDLSKNLSKLLCSDYIVVAKLISDDRAETLAIWHKGNPLKNFVYDLAGSPCETVLKTGCCIYPNNVAELFPDDQLLKEMLIQSYVGVPILSSEHKVIGILIALFKQELDTRGDYYCLMESFSSSAGAEFEREAL